MQCGDLNQRITIEKYIAHIDSNSNGFTNPTWILYKKVWANKQNLYGKEYYAAKAVNAENAADFTIRYTKDLEELYSTESFRIVWKNIIFNIVYVDNIRQENKYLKLKCIQEPRQ